MSHARQRSSVAAVFVGLLGVCVVLWLLRSALDPAPPPRRAAVPTGAATRSGSSTAAPTSQPAIPELPPPPEPPALRGHDTADPCTAGWEPAIPPGFDTVSADGVTVAWLPGEPANPGPNDAALEPTAVAYLALGLLEEAAQLTQTVRRERLTVIVEPSQESFLARAGAPAWSDGIYDGGAVRLAPRPSAELGVMISTLRHELMHAQLHAAVGCMPSWFNEGVAMYFAGSPPARAWIRMLRSPDSFDLTALEVPSLAAMPDDRAERAYAESLAMIVFIVERAGEPGLRAAVRAVQALSREAPRGGLDLWQRLYPGAGHRALLDVLAHKIFGVTLGGELDDIFRGAVCCYGLRTVSELACRGAPLRPDKTSWLDQTGPRRAVCSSTW